MQKILIMETYDTVGIRSEAYGWDIECGETAADYLIRCKERNDDKYRSINQVPVGMVGHPKGFYCYSTPVHALADGWNLMVPPAKHNVETDDGEREYLEWWFEKRIEKEL